MFSPVHRPPIPRATAFTLLEALLALMIFSVAVISLVAAINGAATAWAEGRFDQRVQTRLAALLLESSRLPVPAHGTLLTAPQNRTFKEDTVTYSIRWEPLELRNQDDAPLNQLWSLEVSARWMEAGLTRESMASQWVWLPLHQPRL